jgi:uncharacterized protein YndB with AHSA1/START domain
MDDLRIEAPAATPTVEITRTFNAPRALVWRALSRPEHVINWFGPHGHRNKVLEFDWRVGGKWKIRSTLPDGVEITFFGAYLDIDAPQKVVQTFGVEEMYGEATVTETITLEERDGRTTYRVVTPCATFEERDAMIASGMEKGVREGFERLDAMLERFKLESAA